MRNQLDNGLNGRLDTNWLISIAHNQKIGVNSSQSIQDILNIDVKVHETPKQTSYKNQSYPQKLFRKPKPSKILKGQQMTNLTEQFLHNVLASAEPTQSEINEAVKAVSKKYPNRDPFTFAQALFAKLQEMRQQAEVEKINSQEFPRKSFDFHNFIKKMIAQAYHCMGYGYEKFLHFMLKRHASFHIDEEMYIIFSKGMVLQIYRALERMLIRSGRIIKLKHKNEVMKLNEWILCDGPPPLKEDHQLFKKSLARRYDMGDGSFCIEEANLLYDILEHKYDPFVTKDVDKMNECLNEIELYHDNDQQEMNFDALVNDNGQFLEQPIEINLSFASASSNQCNRPTNLPSLHSHLLHCDSCNPDQLNFDIQSSQELHF